MINKILKIVSDQCEYTKECQLYDNNNCDQYYKLDMAGMSIISYDIQV